MKKIIAFGYVNSSDHWLSLFYLDELIKEGMEVIYLNIDAITLKQYGKIENYSNSVEQIDIHDIKDFTRIVKEGRDNCIFLPCVTISSTVWKLFEILFEFNASIIYLHVGEVPVFGTAFSLEYAKNVFKTCTLKKVWMDLYLEKVIFKSRRKLISSNIRTAFVAGSVAENYQRINGNRNIVNINVRDYDNVLNELNMEDDLYLKPYIPFLDGYLPFHPDNVSINLIIEPDSYYRSINKCFDYMESKYNKEIIIAAHPKSQYEKVGNRFNGRKIIKGETVKLIKRSSFVLNHESTALNYAVGFNKPMVLLTTDNIIKTGRYAKDIETLAISLGCSLINIDKDDELNSIDFDNLKISKEKYDCYKYKYLTSKETGNKRSKEIILHEISKL